VAVLSIGTDEVDIRLSVPDPQIWSQIMQRLAWTINTVAPPA